MRYQLVAVVLLTLGLGGCGGGAVSPPSNAPDAVTTPASSVNSSLSLSAGGGTATASYHGETLSVAAPAGAFSGATTMKITLESPADLTTAFSTARTAATLRNTQGVPQGAVPLAVFIVDIGGAKLAAPLQVTISGLPAPAAGHSVLISGLNNNAFGDVATTTFANGTYGETTDAHYPGITLASPTIYVLYTVPTANVAKPTAVVTINGPATVGPGAQATYTASEATVNGFPFLGHTFTYGVTSAALGTINSSTGVLTGASIGGLGGVTAYDNAVPSYSGTLSVTVSTTRPGAAGLSEQYTGQLNEVDTNNAISTSPVSTTIASTASVAVTTAADAADTSGTTTGVTFTANETDASNLSTISSTTTSTVLYQVQTSGTVDIRLKKTVAAESTGVIYEHDYTPTSGLSTVLPETAGTFTNDASETYLETDPGLGVTTSGQQVTTTSVINADGTYASTFLDPSSITGAPVADTATEFADFHGVLAYNSTDPGNYTVQFAAPANGMITFTRLDPAMKPPLDVVTTVPSWIPAGTMKPSIESDTIGTNVALDAACTNAVTYPTAIRTTQTRTTVDAIFGTVETRTTSSYDVNGVGTVCTVVHDTVNAYYDYTRQESSLRINSSATGTPLITTTVSEALSLQTTNASTLQSMQRASQSIGAVTLPLASIATRVQHIAHARTTARLRALHSSTSTLNLSGGSAK